MMKSTLGLAALLLLACGAASAADLDYSYLDLAYSKQSHVLLSSGSGYQLSGSYALDNGSFFTAVYSHNRFDKDNLDSALSEHYTNYSYELGAGYHKPLFTSTDLVFRAVYGQANSELKSNLAGYGTISDWGFGVGVGLRSRPVDALELEAFLDHDDLGFEYDVVTTCAPFGGGQPSVCTTLPARDLSKEETVASAGARYYFLPSFSLGAEYRHSTLQSMHGWLVSGRWSF